MSVTREQPTTNLFLLEELEDVSRARELADSDLDALRAVAGWIRTFVARPHKDLGRAGPVCPFVPGALERGTLWLAPEQIAGRSVPDVAALVSGYQRLFLGARPSDGDDAIYKSIVVVFTDLPTDRPEERPSASHAPARRRLRWRRSADRCYTYPEVLIRVRLLKLRRGIRHVSQIKGYRRAWRRVGRGI
jgi:hypothetical protein